MPENAPELPPKPANGALARFFQWWHHTPLYLRILGGVVFGVVVGLIVSSLSRDIPQSSEALRYFLLSLETPSKLVLRLLGALAAPLILVAVIQALMHAELPKGSALRLISLLVLNTLVAICIGLLVANVLQPGKWTKIEPPAAASEEPIMAIRERSEEPDAFTELQTSLPDTQEYWRDPWPSWSQPGNDTSGRSTPGAFRYLTALRQSPPGIKSFG